MRWALVGAISWVVAGCQGIEPLSDPDISVLRSAEGYAVISGDYQAPVTIDGYEYSLATRSEALQIAVDNGFFINLDEAVQTFEGKSYNFVYGTISEALAIENVYASSFELRQDMLAGFSGKELKAKYVPSFTVTVVAPGQQ